MKHLIIGNGPAGVTAAETIRRNAPQDEILLVGSELVPPYSRMAIPSLLAGDSQLSGVVLRKERGHFPALRIDQTFGRVIRIDSQARHVVMNDGRRIGFDRLLIASGASPAMPPVPGIASSGVHACWTLDDARKIMALAKPGARVTLIGAGFIGCIVMEALAARGVQLTVVEKATHMMPDMMGAGAGKLIKQWCGKKGIKVHTATRVTAIQSVSRQDRPDVGTSLMACLSNGDQLEADLIVCATGVKPNTSFLQGSGIRSHQGILVDTSMQTNVPGIYAAGDCAEAFDSISGGTAISRVQPNAVDQAYCAALNMTGRPAFQRGVRRIDVLDMLGLISASFGQWRGVPGGQWVEMSEGRNFRYLRLEFDRDVLIGATSIGMTEQTSMLRDLIAHHVALGEWKDKLLLEPARLKEAYKACAQRQYAREAAMLQGLSAAQ